MSTKDLRARIAKRIALEFEDGDVVNLGIGLPTQVVNYLSRDIEVFFQSENGMICMGSDSSQCLDTFDVIDAGGQCASILPHGAFFDSSMSFAIIRGGHVDACVLGALEVDQEGNLANWIIPGKMVPGMGGAMDLVTGSKRVIISMLHTNKGKPKILKKCTLPLTAQGEVDTIITELGVMKVVPEGLLLQEIHEETTVEEIISLTDADLIISDDLKIWKDR